jgi:hypothetical protein
MLKQVLCRIYTNNINESIAFYEQLTGEKCSNRFEYTQVGLELARVQNFLIIAGSDQALLPFRQTNVTFLVDSLVDYRQFLLENKAEIIRDIQVVPTGWNMTVKHADGLVAEYVEHKKQNQ